MLPEDDSGFEGQKFERKLLRYKKFRKQQNTDFCSDSIESADQFKRRTNNNDLIRRENKFRRKYSILEIIPEHFQKKPKQRARLPFAYRMSLERHAKRGKESFVYNNQGETHNSEI